MALVIVDAENVRRSRWPNIAAADLVDLARAWAGREGHDLLVVFDGRPPVEADDVVGVPHADDRIANEAAAREGAWVVTSDRGLRAHVPGAARVIGGGAFADLLRPRR